MDVDLPVNIKKSHTVIFRKKFMRDKNPKVDKNVKLKACTQKSRTIMIQKFAAGSLGGSIEP